MIGLSRDGYGLLQDHSQHHLLGYLRRNCTVEPRLLALLILCAGLQRKDFAFPHSGVLAAEGWGKNGVGNAAKGSIAVTGNGTD